MTKIPVNDMKDQAKRLRKALEAAGTPVTHAAALELTAKQNGYRDWNTAAAAAPNAAPAPFRVGAPVSGKYLGQHFTGTIRAVSSVGDLYRVTTDFDEPVDVVTFDSFSNYRSRVWTLVDKTGLSPQRTSNGTRYMEMSA